MTSAIVMAAGKGTRMHSRHGKTMHKLLDRPMIEHICDTLEKLEVENRVFVIGFDGDSIKDHLGERCQYALQDPQYGTAHAVMQATQLKKETGKTLIINGDCPLISEETYRKLSEERDSRQKQQQEYFDRRDALSDEITVLTKEQLRLESSQEKIEEKLDAETEHLWTEYEISPSEAQAYRDETLTSVNTVRRKAGELRSAIRGLGNINVNAIEQYKEVSGRYEFMKAQYEDLKKAEADLLSIVEELDTGMRKQFTEKFAEIAEAFDRVFRELFGGGQGTIRLQPDVDVIDADISIISQPPGKKLQNMMQLSGGEKALTAISLIFAIQDLKPSPFCLLDEIEAALDEPNVRRFASYLKKLTKNTQFIVITHRRGTMVAADRLYGITMQEKGVSALVSVNLVDKDLEN